MSANLIAALRAASERIGEHRKTLMQARVLCRVYPQGLVFSCFVHAQGDDREDRRKANASGGYEDVVWDQLPSFDEAAARAIVDRVCAKAHAYFGTEPPR